MSYFTPLWVTETSRFFRRVIFTSLVRQKIWIKEWNAGVKIAQRIFFSYKCALEMQKMFIENCKDILEAWELKFKITVQRNQFWVVITISELSRNSFASFIKIEWVIFTFIFVFVTFHISFKIHPHTQKNSSVNKYY